MTQTTYLRFELQRTLRNRRFLLFSIGLPLVLYLTIASTNRNARLDGVAFPLYYMAGMASWGAMLGIISCGSRISLERQLGWTRQLRITPLRTGAYFAAKVICGYLTAMLTMLLLYLAGLGYHVQLSAGQWLAMSGLVLVGLVPFALLGVMLGHLLRPDSLGPAVGGITALLAVFGGAWGPIATHGALLSIVRAIPSYWLVQSGRVALGGGAWTAEGWIVLASWSVAAAWLAVLAYRRDTARVA